MRSSTSNTLEHQGIRASEHQYNRAAGYQSPAALSKRACALALWCSCALIVFLFLTGMASRPAPKVKIRKFKNRSYQLLVENKPYFIKGVCYSPVAIGQGNSEANFWQDPNQPWKVDGELMRQMGVNTVRFYQAPENPEAGKKVVSDLYQLYGIRSIMGSWLGFWEYPCPLYSDTDFRERIKKEVLDMVRAYKDEPGILLWILGNENNYSFSERVNPWPFPGSDQISDIRERSLRRANIYYSFVNELAKEIHQIDPDHPVALGNGELISLEEAAKVCPDVDMAALIIYRGKTFGNLFKSLRMSWDKPVILSEFGADSYDAYLKKEDQNMQALFLEAQWKEIFKNSYPNKDGERNCLGGTMFEWTDEWWKHNESSPETWRSHDTESNWSNGSYYFDIKAERNMNMNEEWFGVVALSGEMDQGINKRIPRKAYYVLRDFWRNPEVKSEKRKTNEK